jgi:hypothetical protein
MDRQNILAIPYPVPAKTPKTVVLCTACMNQSVKPPVPSVPPPPTVGYQGDIPTVAGRFLDSDYVQDIQGPIRTLRAFLVKYDAAHDRIYMNQGCEMIAYAGASFISRLLSGEPLTVMRNRAPLPAEIYLAWTRNFYPEADRNWVSGFLPDGQNFLQDFDFDDRGNVYIAFSVLWGVVSDDFGTTTGGPLTPVTVNAITNSPINPVQTINVIKTADARYYAIVGSTAAVTSCVYDVTNPASPVLTGTTLNVSILQNSLATSSDLKTIALVNNASQRVEMYTPEALVNGGSPFETFAPVLAYRGMATDGSNFYSANRGFTGMSISTFSPTGPRYTEKQTPVGGTFTPYNVKYGNGLLSIPGSVGTAEDIRVFRVPSMSELNFSAFLQDSASAPRYFQAYYGASAVPPGYLNPEQINFTDSLIYTTGGITYLVANLRGIGDVYQLPSS